MKYWLMMFRPETYGDVKAHRTIGVRTGARKLLKELSVGDPFLAYLSRVQQLDGIGTVAGETFVDDTPIFSGGKVYEHRCNVAFTESGFARPVADTLWSLSCFPSEMKTTPSNYIYCKGGIIEVTEDDYDFLVRVMRGEEEPKRLAWKDD
ncbi:MAG: EVE domain-containing protein [Deltaproteobacteria bacterium]|nr:MAG: EVE domain-containing protein [Deltaproteobacteria bacterium]